MMVVCKQLRRIGGKLNFLNFKHLSTDKRTQLQTNIINYTLKEFQTLHRTSLPLSVFNNRLFL